MKTKIVIVSILIMTAAGAGWLLFQQRAAVSTNSIHKHADIYYCPMHPQYTSDRPGTCPICNMNLVKKESPAAEESTESPSTESVPGHAAVSLNSHQEELIGLETVPVIKKNLTRTIHAYGYVAHDLELYDAQVEYVEAWREYFAFQGRRSVKEEFREDWRSYYIRPLTQNRWRNEDKLKAQQRLQKAEYELIHMGLTEAQIRQLRKIKYGQLWLQTDLLFFENDQPFWIYAQVLESDLGFLAPFQKVVARVPAYHETIEGTIVSIAPFIDPVTRTARVRIEMPEYKGGLSINMFVNVDIQVELDHSLLVPRDAVMDTGVRKIVFVQTAKGKFEPREIQTGLEGGGMVAVVSGLQEGERVVAKGNFLIDSESRLQAAFNGMSGAAGGGHVHGQ